MADRLGGGRRQWPKRPWKKFMRKLPPLALEKVAGFAGELCVVGAVREIPRAMIARGDFAHVGLQVAEDGSITVPGPAIPLPENGLYSERNVTGYVRKLRHLPKIPKEQSRDLPDWGDWTRGYHTVSWSQMVYPRVSYPPREFGLEIDILHADDARDVYFVRFRLDAVLDRTDAGFEEQLLFAFNVLQENVGGHDVLPSEATAADYLRTLFVDWDILPPGDREKNLSLLAQRSHVVDAAARGRLEARYDALVRLGPGSLIAGRSGFRNYFGALFADDFAVFENLDYGNALYLMFENWETLSKKSRTELLTEHATEINRIPHRPGWEARLERRVSEEMTRRGDAGNAGAQ